ncbi:putative methyltransferase (TIGR04325 family) [Bosea sp. BE125]|uniref:methyltransferase, TIGR04325 family n=1 Tax=Bosea sp. BE125 TaxID=2817909 RepID=UPI0028566437|nr:methyltransferase, TIGR04325 family [Bosea sp. BE125]MDR6871812.1 putative methyltransferase (TIGR04325 family) [Bosea sp. BE125]
MRRWLYQNRFQAGKYHCGYSGVYGSFEAARLALPPGLAGFDHDAMADIDHYTTTAGGFEPMPATEYPVLFWLREALDEGARTLLDLGGYVGHAFRQYDRYLAFPGDFRWTVFDVPRITEAGQALAGKEAAQRLRFTNTIDEGCGMDILLAAGSLQYLSENYLQDRLNAWADRPRHVIVQRTPLHARRSFVTIQSVITRARQVAFCPYSVAERDGFIDGMLTLGYQLVDSWEKPRSLDVPFHPECHVETYSGLYFRLKAS